MLRRKLSQRLIGGVCAGVAQEYDLDVTILRLIAVLGFVLFGVGPIVYLIAWLFMPAEVEQ